MNKEAAERTPYIRAIETLQRFKNRNSQYDEIITNLEQFLLSHKEFAKWLESEEASQEREDADYKD